MTNLFSLPKMPLTEELTTILTEQKGIRIERIISTGQTSQWYDQEEWEFVALLSGNANLEYDKGETISLEAGDTLLLPPHCIHRVAYTSTEPPCVWLCIFWRD